MGDPRRTTRTARARWWAGIAAAAMATGALAQGTAYPVRPVRLIVPYPAGSSTNDILGRAMAQRLTEALGQQVVVDNRPGAGGNLGSEMAAKSAPDGYTLLLGTNGPICISPHVYRKLAYDPFRDLATVTFFAVIPYVIVVHPSVPAKNAQELIAAARAKPGTIHFGSAGNASTPHLASELFKSMAGIDIVHIPYKGGAPATIDLLAGQVQMYSAGLVSMAQHIKSGRVRAIGTTTLKRSALMPELPTIAEQGLPGYDVNSWNGIHVPAATPRPLVERLHREIVRVVDTPEFRTYLAGQGGELMILGPKEFAEYIRVESAKWGKVAKAAGLKLD